MVALMAPAELKLRHPAFSGSAEVQRWFKLFRINLWYWRSLLMLEITYRLKRRWLVGRALAGFGARTLGREARYYTIKAIDRIPIMARFGRSAWHDDRAPVDQITNLRSALEMVSASILLDSQSPEAKGVLGSVMRNGDAYGLIYGLLCITQMEVSVAMTLAGIGPDRMLDEVAAIIGQMELATDTSAVALPWVGLSAVDPDTGEGVEVTAVDVGLSITAMPHPSVGETIPEGWVE